MTPTRWEPFEGLASLRGEMDWLFAHFFERPPGTMFSNGRHVRAAVEIADTDDSIVVQVQVPGVSKDNLREEFASIKTMHVQ